MAEGNTTITPGTGSMEFTGYAPTVWIAARFAKWWFRDAAREAEGTDGEHSTHREIVFAASFLESYIFEWACGVCGVGRIDNYFPPERHQNVKEKWKNVPGKLHADGLISRAPDLDLSELGTLVAYRNGLLHARASRPSAADLDRKSQPAPAPGQLGAILHGWARDVAKNLVLKLHCNLGTPSPTYLNSNED